MLVLGTISASAQKCKYVKKKMLDKYYAGMAIKQTKGVMFFSTLSKSGTISFLELKNCMTMNVFMDRMYGRALDYLKTDPLIFYFSDSTSLKLYPYVEFDGVTGIGNEMYSTSDAPRYSITKDDVELLATKRPVKVEIYYTRKLDDKESPEGVLNDEFLDFKINKGMAKKIMFSAKCFLE